MCEAKCSRENSYKSILREIKAAAKSFFRLYTVKSQPAYFYTLVLGLSNNSNQIQFMELII